jgi:hypothetical protein
MTHRMTNDDANMLPQDPGPVPPAVVDAFARLRDRDDASPMPSDADIDALADAEGTDDARLSSIEALLGSHDGRVTLAHIVAARQAVTADMLSEPLSVADTMVRSLTPRLAPATPQRRSRWMRYAAAACVVFASALVLRRLAARADDDAIRTAGSAVIAVPTDDAVDPGAAALVWRAVNGARYRLEVLDTAGAPVFVRETNDTLVQVPAGMLQPAMHYRWFVRAFRQDGTEIRSAVQQLQTR